jgi:hypothetical protein
MRIRSLLSLVVACGAVGACAAPANEPVSAQPRDPVVRTGTRLPGNNSGMTGTIGQDELLSGKARQGQTGDLMK